MDREAAAQQVLEQGEAAGFDLCGIAPAAPSRRAAFVRQWIAAGRHGEMHYLEDNLELRLDPRAMMPGCKSIVAVAMFYGPPEAPPPEVLPPEASPPEAPPPEAEQAQSQERRNETPLGELAKYAADFPGGDYHKVMKRRLHAMADALRETLAGDWRACVDTAPVLEREHAAAAGLGWIGKHTLLIHPRRGSWMALGVLLTTVDLATSEQLNFPGDLVPDADHCGTCTRCIDACPTAAITPYSVDASRCISYLTIEHRSAIDPALEPPMGSWLAGCDVCQVVCPHPRKKHFVELNMSAPPAAHGRWLDLLQVLGWSAADRQAALRGSALKRIKLDMWKRNALIALGNRPLDAATRQRIEAVASDAEEAEMVRATARRVLARSA